MSRSIPTAASESRFSHRLDALQQLAQDVLLHAGKQGASACEVFRDYPARERANLAAALMTQTRKALPAT